MNAFEELRAWINRDRPARSAHLDTVGDDTTADPQAVSPATFASWHPRVVLHFEGTDGSEREVQGIGTTFDDALIAALEALPGHSDEGWRAALAWDGRGEPKGWTRHPRTGRVRPDGTPSSEAVER